LPLWPGDSRVESGHSPRDRKRSTTRACTRILPGFQLSAVIGAQILSLSLACGGGGGGSRSSPHPPQLGIMAPSMATAGDQKTASATLFQGATYNWTIQDGAFTSGISTNSVSFTVGAPGTLTLGCTATLGTQDLCASAPMEVLHLPVINTFATAPASIAAGESVQLTADFVNGVGNLQPGNLALTSGVPITVAPMATTIYTLNVGNAAGGNSAFAIIVTVGAGNPVVVTEPAEVTAGQAGYSASVPSQPGSTYRWMITNGTITAGDSTPQITFTPGASGAVQLSCTIISAGGTAANLGMASLTIVPPAITPVITAPAKVSAGATGLIASVPVQPGSTYAWAIENGTITTGGSTDQITFTAGLSGSVQLGCTVTNGGGTATARWPSRVTLFMLVDFLTFMEVQSPRLAPATG